MIGVLNDWGQCFHRARQKAQKRKTKKATRKNTGRKESKRELPIDLGEKAPACKYLPSPMHSTIINNAIQN